jgi:hypothetical protein
VKIPISRTSEPIADEKISSDEQGNGTIEVWDDVYSDGPGHAD